MNVSLVVVIHSRVITESRIDAGIPLVSRMAGAVLISPRRRRRRARVLVLLLGIVSVLARANIPALPIREVNVGCIMCQGGTTP